MIAFLFWTGLETHSGLLGLYELVAELSAHLGGCSLIWLSWRLSSRHTWGFLPWVYDFYDRLNFTLPVLAGGTHGVALFSVAGLVTNSGLLGIADYVAELMAHWGFLLSF